jgi:hypothetical protein
VRLSRGGASAPGKPDILGLAVKIQDLHGAGKDQDFLLVTAKGDHGLASRIPKTKEETFAGQTFSSLTNYGVDAAEGRFKGPITTRTDGDFTRSGRFHLSVEQRGFLRSVPRGTTASVEGDVQIHFDQPLSKDESAKLRFTPWNTGGAYKPKGLINWVRKGAYAGSQAGRSREQ